MATHKVKLLPDEKCVDVPTGTLITEAATAAGLEITQPCGGQGRCGRCAVKIEDGSVRRRSTIRLNTDDLDSGWALACQSLIEGDAVISIPEQERIERRLVTGKTALAIELPFDYIPAKVQSIQTYQLSLTPPTLDDSQDDLARLRDAIQELGYDPVEISLSLLQRIGSVLRESDWKPHVLLDAPTPGSGPARLIEIGASPIHPHGLALDIGTTTVTAYLVDLISGKVKASAAEYNGQIAR
ncbi:MAG: 2Fe-2S iron-sulfur cluster binding domain-containing protein, partial [Anaerolineales bacterium]|nr:2Fe-2S iron-sulfur cluster binding domain-containing protein [Anaerolineales bacterium]